MIQMEASKPKWVNFDCIRYVVNSLRLEDLHMYFQLSFCQFDIKMKIFWRISLRRRWNNIEKFNKSSTICFISCYVHKSTDSSNSYCSVLCFLSLERVNSISIGKVWNHRLFSFFNFYFHIVYYSFWYF